MRTTLDLTTEAYHVAKSLARERNLSLGKVVSEFILLRTGSGHRKTKPVHSAAGFPVFASGKRVTSEDVRALIDEDMLEED
jgi:hypothetical protein